MPNQEKIIIRKLLIGDDEFPYRIRFSNKAKYLRLQISNSNSLEMVLPHSYNLSEAEKFLIRKKLWIKKYLVSKQAKPNKYFLFGNEVSITHNYDLFIKRHKTVYHNFNLTITSPSESNTDLKTLYELWLKKTAKVFITERVKELAEKYNFKINKINIRGQKTRWGSCSSKGRLSFNYRLMQFNKDIMDYVIIHELCHLLEMNHSPRFWKLVESYCPNYKLLKKGLRSNR